jgi:hypothetical protein
VKLTVCRALGALSEKVRVALSAPGAPAAGGAKLTLTGQVPPGAMVAPLHPSAPMTKKDESVPERVKAPAPKIKLAFPLFVTAMVCAGLEVLSCW